jgi:uroporphyrinogen-III synthase
MEEISASAAHIYENGTSGLTRRREDISKLIDAFLKTGGVFLPMLRSIRQSTCNRLSRAQHIAFTSWNS